MKQFASWFTHGVTGGSALRKAVYSDQEGPAILASVDQFFQELLSGRIPALPVALVQPKNHLLPAREI